MRGIIWSVLLTAASWSATAAQNFNLEQIMGAPFPTGLVAAPSGDRVAWVQNDRGVRNIWVADGPAWTGRQLTTYEADDGQELGELAFTSDGARLLFVRGGAPNRQGEIPNPLSDPEGAAREIWVVGMDGSSPAKVAAGSTPTPSPRGTAVAFLQRGAVWKATLEEEAEEPREMFEIRGRAGSLRWAPDGSKLAFVSSRGDHSFIGVYDVEAGALRYLTPTVDRDGNPVWSPEGTRLAYTRFPNLRDALPFMPRREGQPWSIRVADVSSGESHTVWTAEEGPGSVFRGISAPNEIFWTSDDRIVFPWERTGWTNLYAVRAGGGTAVALTPGEFEVEHVTLAPDGRTVIYSSNEGDIDRRHLWRVSPGGGGRQAVTSGAGIEWAPVVTTGTGTVAFLASDARTPAHATVLPAPNAERKPLAAGTMPRDFPSEDLVEPQAVEFSAADGMPIHGQLFLPPNHRSGRQYPAVLFFHGGSRRQMLLGFHYLGYYHNAYAMNQYLASRGFVVMSVNYRSGIGYGLEFREALNYGARGASEFNDVMGAGVYLRSRSDVDPNRIGLWGGSYGGYLTALGLARASDLFAAGVDLHGVHDWNQVIRNFVPSYNPMTREEVSRLAYESSPMASVETWRSPVLLIHGDDDRNVPFSETVDLVEALRKQNVEFEQLIFPDEVHGFLLHRNWLSAYRATADFFERKLGPETTAQAGGR